MIAIKHIFMCFYWTFMYFFWCSIIQIFYQYLTKLFIFLLLGCKNYLYIQDSSPDICIMNILYFLNGTFQEAEIFILTKINSSAFSSMICLSISFAYHKVVNIFSWKFYNMSFYI